MKNSIIEQKSKKGYNKSSYTERYSLFESEFNQNKLSQCPSVSNFIRFQNTITGQSLPVPCNRYACPFCGPRKSYKLFNALNNYFSQFKHIRLWTFTLSSRVASNRITHYKLFSECWRRLIIELRRSHTFTKKQHKFEYVRVCEPHSSGYFHYHCLFTEYFDRNTVQRIWDHICQHVTGDNFHVATASVKGMITSRIACKYICKYVLKSATFLYSGQKKWSKSKGPSIFPKKIPSGEWSIVYIHYDYSDQFLDSSLSSYLTCNGSGTTSHNREDFPDDSSPGDDSSCLFYHDLFEYNNNFDLDILNISSSILDSNFKSLSEFFSVDLYTN